MEAKPETILENLTQEYFKQSKVASPEQKRAIYKKYCQKFLELLKSGQLNEEQAAYTICGVGVFDDDLNADPDTEKIIYLAGDLELPLAHRENTNTEQAWAKLAELVELL